MTVFAENPPRGLSAPFFVRGNLIEGAATSHRSRDLGVDFSTPAVDLDALVTPRSTLPPLLDVPLEEIIDFLVETGERMALDKNPHMQQCLDLVAETNPLPRRVVENLYHAAPYLLTRDGLWAQVESNFADPAVLDGWVGRTDAHGNSGAIRAFPPRIVHMLAGNAPAGCIASIAQGALVKAINLFKMPSADPFTTVAVLRTMAEIDAKHPVVRSMSAVYWQGGDDDDRAHALPTAVLRQDRGVGRRPGDTKRHQVSRARHPARLLRPQVLDLDDRT